MAGLTDDGFVGRRQPEILEALLARLEASDDLDGLNVRAGPIHQIASILSEELASVWEGLEETYASQYDGASGVSLDRVAALTGTTRRAATRSTVTATVNLNAGVTLPAGSVAAVAGSPDRQFRSVADVTNGGGVAANVSATFESVEPGPVSAPAGTLTVIVGTVAGWNTITNAADADLGSAAETDAELRVRRLRELAGAGRRTLASLAASISRIAGVEEVRAYENATSATDGDGRPAKSVEAVIWDGSTPAADDDAIAQAIYEHVAEGIAIHGVGESGTATEPDTGETITVAFTRATAVRAYLSATVILVDGAAAGWADLAKEALAARGQAYGVGVDAYATQLACVLGARPEVEAVVSLTIGTAPAPSGSSIAAGADEVIRFDTADMTLST